MAKTKKKEEEKAVTEASKEVTVVDIIKQEVEELNKLEEQVRKEVEQLFSDAQRALVLNETPRYQIERREGRGGQYFEYVKVGYVIEQVNLVTGNRYNWRLKTPVSAPEYVRFSIEIGQFIVEGALTIFSKDGTEYTREDTGNAEIKKLKAGDGFVDLGDDIKAATSDCFKRCARFYGFALDVYSGSAKRRQDSMHPQAPITETQRKRLEVIATETGIGHSGLKKVINKLYDYTSTTQIQRRHFEEIVKVIEMTAKPQEATVIPDDIKTGFDLLGTPQGARIAAMKKYEGKLDELRAKINKKVDEQQAASEAKAGQDKGTK